MSGLSELIDLPVERLPAVIATTWRDFHPLSPVPETVPPCPGRPPAAAGAGDSLPEQGASHA